MEANIVSNLNPVYRQLYQEAFKGNKLNVYVKEENIDGWIRSLDLYLVYDKDAELALAERVVRDLALDTGAPADEVSDEEPDDRSE